MAGDKYSATWVSYSSISDYLACPRAYYLKNVYRNPATGHKMKIASPPLSLGQAVHEVIEGLSVLPTDSRFKEPLTNIFDTIWSKYNGRQGGFLSKEAEHEYKTKGEKMLLHVMENPGPLKNLAVKIRMDLPYYWLSEEFNIILCGKIDWLEYKSDGTVHVIDFKTGRHDEDPNSLQLSIYYLLAKHCQKHAVSQLSYWYLQKENGLQSKSLPDLEKTQANILDIAKKIKVARSLNVFRCPEKNGCRVCRPYEAILKGNAELVGTNSYGEDIYLLDHADKRSENESIIL